MFRKIFSFLFRKKSPLKRELDYLNLSSREVERQILHIKSLPFTCCSFCAHPELNKLCEKHERQLKRKEYLEKKLNYQYE